ncbi:MAG TPA: hypothetical protein VF189_00720, partial [Patescibacteria group bacterium]
GCGACVSALESCNVSGVVIDDFGDFCYTSFDQNWIKFLPNGSCGDTEDFCTNGCRTLCNSGTTNCGACTGGFIATNDCGTITGSQTCQHNAPQTCTNTNFARSCSHFVDNCSANYTCSGGTTCVTNIIVHVYIDYGHDGGNDANYPSGVVTINGGGAQTTGADGTVTFSGLTSGNTYTIAYSDNSPDYQPTGATSQNVSLNNGNGNYNVTFRVTPLYKISGNVFTDANHNKNYDGSDTLYTGNTTIHVSGGPTSVADMNQTSGTYDTGEVLTSGTYTISQTHSLASGYTYTTPTSWNVTVGNPVGAPDCSVGASPDAACVNPNNGSVSGLNFGVDKPYQISGSIFNDKNKDLKYNGSDSLYTGGSSISITGPTNMSVNASAGTYSTGQVLLPGTYTVTYNTTSTPLPAGYEFQTSNTFQVVVGYSPVCSPGGSPDATCGAPNNGSAGAGSINDLNFGLNNEHPHDGGVCLDLRTDNQGAGTISDQFPPAGATCGGLNGSQAVINNGTCSTGSGIVFSCDGTFDFGLGSADANNWTAGGASPNTECYSGGGLDVIPTSYDFMTTTARQSNITPTNLDNLTNPNPATSCTTTDCILPTNLPKGIYQVNGDLTLDSADYTFPAPPDPTTESYAYIILVNGDLHINGNIYVPKGSVALFSVSGNIYVDKSVGNTITNVNSSTVNAPNLEGVYSADKSFIVESYGAGNAICNADGTPLDKRLVVLGIVITNAAKAGGSLTNNRDLCVYDNNCSSILMGDGTNGGDGLGGSGEGLLLNYLLNLLSDGQFVNTKIFNWQELKP